MNLTINHCIVLFNILFVVVYMSYLFKIKAFKMNAEPLTHQPLFKAALTIPIISFFCSDLLHGMVTIFKSIQKDLIIS